MFAKQFFNRNRVLGMAVLAAALASAGAQAQTQPGSTAAAMDEVVQIMSVRAGVPDSDITTSLRSTTDDTMVVLAAAPQRAGFDRVCRYDMVKDATANASGWKVTNSPCSF